MSKIQKATRRSDSEDHQHSVPKSDKSAAFSTCGMLKKPNANSRAGFHTHLYEHDGDVYETDAAYNEPGHMHDTEFGMSGGPEPLEPKGKELPRTAV
ncbi:hypothetical protein [Staphylococcus capitis]|jgi:hypothetical protein|uniref:hypothetical protein n=1 Tax=Staphylococcus capitis TaxID=29388 RepID=UPI00145A8F9E|nr:hypothetical protein [Staphylococcus capitis]NMK73087.1 hypothetical protein [Staphylococcus capitis]